MIEEPIDEETQEDTSEERSASEAESQLQELAELRAREAEHRDQLLRGRADLENQRKRLVREAEEARKFALQNFIHELLPVKDSLEQGLEAASTDAGQEAEGLRQGIQLTLKLWQDVLAREGVEEIDPLGQTFNPDFHEALSIRHSLDVPPDTVLEVIQKGYLLNGRLVRAARVVVADGGDGAGASGPANSEVVGAEFE